MQKYFWFISIIYSWKLKSTDAFGVYLKNYRYYQAFFRISGHAEDLMYTLYNCILYLQVSFNTVNYMDSMNHNIHKISCTELGHILASNDTCNPVNVGYSQFWPPSKQTVCRISRILQHWCSTRGKILEYRIRVKIKISIHEFVLSYIIVKY